EISRSVVVPVRPCKSLCLEFMSQCKSILPAQFIIDSDMMDANLGTILPTYNMMAICSRKTKTETTSKKFTSDFAILLTFPQESLHFMKSREFTLMKEISTKFLVMT